MRPRRHVRRPPDLTSLFDVLFIVVFAALIRAAAVERAAAKPPAPPAPSAAPATPPAVAVLQRHALAALDADLAARTPLVVRITANGTVEALDVGARRIALDAPLLEHSPNPDVMLAYLGDRSAELRVCRIAALHLGVTELSRYFVIIAPALPLADLSEALYGGLYRDLERCLTEQHGLGVVIDPGTLPHAPAARPVAPPSPPPPTPPPRDPP
jgi:hypothetical protein